MAALGFISFCWRDIAHGAPLEAYGRLPTFENAVVSPAGDRLAYAQTVGTRRGVVVVSVADRVVLGGVMPGEHDIGQNIRTLSWADNDHLLIHASQTSHIFFPSTPGSEVFFNLCYDVSKKRLEPLTGTQYEGVPEARIVDGNTLVFVNGTYSRDSQFIRALFQVDLARGGKPRIVEGKSWTTQGWLIDARGNAVVQKAYEPFLSRWTLSVKRDGDWVEALRFDAPVDLPDVIGLSADGKAALVRLRTDEGYQLKLVSLSDASVTDAPRSLLAFDDFVVDAWTGQVVAGVKIGLRRRFTFFDPNDEAAWKAIVDAFGDQQVDFVSWSANRKRVLVDVSGPGDGDKYELVDLDSNRGIWAEQVYAGIGSDDLAPVSSFTYAASDGLEIPSYLTLPRGREAKSLPLIVLAHGGPADRDAPGFDWWSQALASRGYAVLRPQFRGSGGLGWPHLSAGFGQWGRKMQTDLSDGVRALAAKGIIDSKRVCIVGASYGGYAALAGPSLDPGVYRCAVSVSGLSDLREMLAWERHRTGRSDSLPMRYWTRFMGVADRDDPALDQISPVKFAGKIDAPILLIHGHDDTVVPIAQSQEMADALKAAGKPVTFVELASEDHWLSRSETRLQMLKATVDFLEKNNPP